MSVLIKYTFIQGELAAPGQPGLRAGGLSCPGCPSPAASGPTGPGWPRRAQLPGGTDSFTGHGGSCPGSRNGNSSKAGSPLARLVPAGGGCLALGSWGTPEAQRSPRPSFPLVPVWGGSGQCFPAEPPPAARKSGGGSSGAVRKRS